MQLENLEKFRRANNLYIKFLNILLSDIERICSKEEKQQSWGRGSGINWRINPKKEFLAYRQKIQKCIVSEVLAGLLRTAKHRLCY